MSGRLDGPPINPALIRVGDRASYSEITLRDLFAMAALQGMLACPSPAIRAGDDYEEVRAILARTAYELADNMLKARATRGREGR